MLFECPPSEQLRKCPASAQVPECPLSAQGKFRVALTLTMNEQGKFMVALILIMNEKHFSEVPFKAKNHKILANSRIYFYLCLYNTVFWAYKKHIKILIYINNTL